MPYTLTLDTSAWDLTLDGAGNIATSTGLYAMAQNVANAARLFRGEAWFAKEKGVPHFEIELGHPCRISEPVLRSRVKRAALAVDGVVDAFVTLSAEDGRVTGGEILIAASDGQTASVAF
jgi:hypothetical protein